MNFPDLLIQQVLQSGIALMRTAPAIIQDAAAGMPGIEPDDVLAWMQNQGNVITTRLGYAQATQLLPCVSVVMSEEDEQLDRQIIGGGIDMDMLGDGLNTQRSVTLVNGTVRCLVYSPNATLAAWIAGMVRYLLLQNRGLLDVYGLYEQRLSASDFQPAPEMGPDVSFVRVVSLSFTYELSWTAQLIDPAAIISGFTATFTEDVPIGPSATTPPPSPP